MSALSDKMSVIVGNGAICAAVVVLLKNNFDYCGTLLSEVGTSAPESAPPLRAEHQFRSGMQRAEHAKKNGAE